MKTLEDEVKVSTGGASYERGEGKSKEIRKPRGGTMLGQRWNFK